MLRPKQQHGNVVLGFAKGVSWLLAEALSPDFFDQADES